MQTILGASGPIGEGLVRELHDRYTTELRLVSRKPAKLHDTDELVAADLADAEATDRAVAGSDIVYFTAGLPANTDLWSRQFPVMMENVLAACERHGAKLVFFDNTYMYAGTTTPQTEETPFRPGGRKGEVRGEIATMVLDAIASGRVDALICRAPEFYGPGRTKSFTNALVFDRIKAGKMPLVPLNAKARRSLIWTPDASRAMALLGNTPDAFGQTWHLPIDPNRLTYAEIIRIAGEVVGRRIRYLVLPEFAMRLVGRFNPGVAEIVELLPRYRGDNLFDSSKFADRFPEFRVTTYREGITTILRGDAR